MLAFVGRETNPERVQGSIAPRGRLVALSLGPEAGQHRVVIPAEIEDPPVAALNDMRAAATEMFKLIGETSALAGLEAWLPAE
jgi:hypothetical protein